MIQKLLWLALAGALGTLARYGLSGWVQRGANSGFPWGTLAVNALGCFLFGLVWTLTQERLPIPGAVRAVVLIGFLGSFTTFSAFLFETDQMLEQSQWLLAGLNVTGELAAGLAAYLSGAALGRLI